MKKGLLTLLAFGMIAFSALQAQVVISEIMYNPPEAGTDSLEFIELYNSTNAAINLEGWSFSGVTLIFPAGTSIAANGYLVTAVKSNAMQEIYGVSAIQWTSGGLSNGGETIKLLDNQAVVIDEVAYSNQSPWPIEANAIGYSLELCDLTADNNDPAFWKKSGRSTGQTINGLELFASPGLANSATCLPDADFTVTVANFSFTPKDITIQEGQSVLWNNAGGNHNINGSKATYPNNPEGFSNGPASSAAWNFVHTFTLPGVYTYQCDPHAGSGMKGTVTVVPYQAPEVVITEFMYNDPGSDSLEYIELYNRGTTPADLSGWLFSAGVTHIFANGTVIPAGGYLVLAKDAAYFEAHFGFTPIQWTNGALTNTGELIELRDGTNKVVDQFAYQNTTPWPLGTNGEGASVVLCDPSLDNAQPGNWIAAASSAGFMINGIEVFANPNAPSGCSGNTDASDDMVTLPQNTTLTISPLVNDFLPGAVTAFTIVTQPAHGTATITNQTVAYKPAPDYCGADQFVYKVCVGTNCDQATVSIDVLCYPQFTIEQVTKNDANGVALSDSLVCEIQGTVHGVNIRPNGLQFWVLDLSNNGIGVFNNSGNLGYTPVEGDQITIRGRISQFAGLTQINPDAIDLLSTNNQLVTPSVVLRINESTESSLVRINNLELVNIAQWTTGSGGSGFNALAVSASAPQDTIDIRIDNDVSLYNSPYPVGKFDIIGIGSQFDQSSPYTSGYQLLPRYTADLIGTVSNQERQLATPIVLAPNPSNGAVWVKAAEQLDRITVYNAVGQIVLQVQNPSPFYGFDASAWTAGAYFTRFEKGGKSRTEVLMIQ